MYSDAKNSLRIGILTYLICLSMPVGLKFFGLASISWWWAWVALWAPMAFTGVFLLVTLLIKLVATFLTKDRPA